MKSFFLAFIALAVIAFSGMALADTKEFKDLDVNADGSLDQAEFAKAEADSPFDEFDENEDGKVTKQEYEDKLAECE